jgi:hypothetical protein
MVRRSVAAGLALLLPFAALAFEAVDTLTPATSGRYPAYPAAPVPLTQYWVQGGVMFDTNILRRTESPGTETVFRLGVGGRHDTYVYGRQLLRLEGRLDGYVYDRFGELDNIGYGGLAEWHWELGNDLAGVLGVARRRYQADIAQTQRAERDLITETRYVATGGYRLGPSFRVRGGAELSDFRRPLVAASELQTVVGFVGLDYVTGLGNTFGIEYRQSHGDAPVSALVDPLGLFVNNDFKQRDIGFTTGYITPFLRLAARVFRTHREYSELPQHNFDGTTWRASADWLVGYKTALGFETYREPRSTIDIAASHVVVRGVAFGPGWAPTAKLAFSARILREDQQYGGDETAQPVPGLPFLHEILRGVRLGSYWEYDRQLHFQFAIDHGDRESNGIGRNYRYNAVMANARYLFW